MANSASKIWVLRMPGGPTKVVKSKKEITEDQAKAAYLQSVKFVRTETVRSTVWPLVKTLDDESVKEYELFTQPSNVSGKPRAMVEV